MRRGLGEKKEKRKRKNCEEVRSKELCNPYFEYNKAKVLVDVATSLVVNHVNIGMLKPQPFQHRNLLLCSPVSHFR